MREAAQSPTGAYHISRQLIRHEGTREEGFQGENSDGTGGSKGDGN
jgi:hypothetical protein